MTIPNVFHTPRVLVFLLIALVGGFFTVEAQSPNHLTCQAVVVAHQGTSLKLQAEGEALPPVGLTAEMEKRFEEKLGKMTMQGWLGVAEVRIVAVEDRKITLEILEEKSEILVNDEKVDHFKVGKLMKLSWEGATAPGEQ